MYSFILNVILWRLLIISVVYSGLLLSGIPQCGCYHSVFNHSVCEGHPGSIQFMMIINKAVLNTMFKFHMSININFSSLYA